MKTAIYGRLRPSPNPDLLHSKPGVNVKGYFAWSLLEGECALQPYGSFHDNIKLVIAKLIIGVGVLILCSYITLPLYALVSQMGSNMKKSIFDEQTSKALKNWRMAAVKKKRGGGSVSGSSPTAARTAAHSPSSRGYGGADSSRIHLTLARLLQGFDLSTPMGKPVDMSEGLGIALPKVKPLEVTITPRLSPELYEAK